MKTIYLILSLFFCLSASAVNRVTITVTITNTPAAGNTFVPNGSTRTWRSSVTTPSTEIAIGANIGASATNLFRQLAGYPLSGPVTLGFSSSNVVTIQGAAGESMAATASGTWATISYYTNLVSPGLIVRVPITVEPTGSTATNIASLVVTNIGILSTNPLRMIYGIRLPIPSLGVTNAILFEPGFAAIAPDASGNPGVFNAVTGLPWEANSDSDILNLFSAKLNFPQGYAVVTNIWISTNIFGYIEATGPKLTNPTLLGGGGTNLSFTNITLKATNYSTGIWGHTRANNTSLANANNAGIDFGAKVFIKIKAGPTAPFAICGIAGGADGRELYLYNATGQDMTIANDSGVEPTAANRIYTGGVVATTGNGAVHLIYDSEDSRWVVLSFQQ